jgi:hypothetical protein
MIFSHCLLSLSQLLFLFLESRFGTVTRLFNVVIQCRHSSSTKSASGQTSCLRSGCGCMWDAQLIQQRSKLFVPHETELTAWGAGLRPA